MTATSTRLSAGQLETYAREEFLILNENVFAPEKFDRLKTHFEAKLAVLDPTYRTEALDVRTRARTDRKPRREKILRSTPENDEEAL